MDPERVPLIQKGPVSLRRTRRRWAAFATVGLILTAACIACILRGGSLHATKLLLLEKETPRLIGDDTPDQFEHSDPNDERLPAIANAVKDAINSGRQSCSGKAQGDKVTSVRVLSARHQFVSREDREYEVEVESIDVHGFSQVFVANVRWRHADDALISRSKGTSVQEKAQMVAMIPGPCDLGDSAELVLTSARVDHINAQNLPWTAALNSRFRGVSLDKFSRMLGYKPESAKHKSLSADVLSATPGVALPAAYDARDTRAHESPCVAFQPKNQGSCGSCYAFGTTSAFATRLCLSSKRAVNFDLSFQEVMDCNTGCDGGTSSDVYNTMYTKPTVPVTCDSYSAVFDPKSCGVHSCQKPLQVFAEKDSYRVYKGVPAMQEELLVNGPGPVAYTVYDDFAAYRYVRFQGARCHFHCPSSFLPSLTPPTAAESTPNPAVPKRPARTWFCSWAGARKQTALLIGLCKIRGVTRGAMAVSSR
jgi:C1A family cysteine protease